MKQPRAYGLAARIAVLATCALALVAAAPVQAQTPDQLLRNRPFAPTDRALFLHAVYPNNSADTPATGTTLTEAQGRAKLKSYLQTEYPNSTATQNAGLAVYDNATAKQKVPDPQLRAALAALEGTFADPAINRLLNSKTSAGNPRFVRASYGGNPFGVVAISAPYNGSPDPDDYEFFFDPTYRYESPFLLTPFWLHEPLHEAGPNGIYEEGANSSFDELFYGRQLVRHPGLARMGTKLARTTNTLGLARLNSGLGSRLGLYATNGGRQLYPGSSSFPQKSWWALIQRIYPSSLAPRQVTDGNALLGQYLAATHETGAPSCSAAKFSKALLDCIDKNRNGRTSSASLVAAARAMKLNVGN
jgi:hypothetical protein